ncbi:nuclear factor related to kappa-B-binding protein isoform X2 [Ischnura elegans]|uniref:nuclear factor related to kappa-B-binding protein isoform X2 n=1 Tax=Ischnura elegans TaxID=197161 RepID=UPI001ED87DC7|nr:nuclear factor related to kappa-B-binding protein isoform X2 [Ischnura elegans]
MYCFSSAISGHPKLHKCTSFMLLSWLSNRMDLEYSTHSSEESSTNTEQPEFFSDRLENCRFGKVTLKLPQGMCESKEIFMDLLSHRNWQNSFSAEQKEHLRKFLPVFPQNDAIEKEKTIKKLFSGETFRFTSPLIDVHTQLQNGHFRPDIAKMRSIMKKVQQREYRYRQRRYYFRVMKELLVSRRRLLEAAFRLPPDTSPRAERIPPPPKSFPVAWKTRRRYFRELACIREEVGESSQSSEDENYPDGPPPKLSKKQKKQLLALESSFTPDVKLVTSTLAVKPSGFDLESNVTSNYNPYEITDETYKAMLLKHKKRRSAGDDHPELNTRGIMIQDVAQRCQTTKRQLVRPTGPSVHSNSKETHTHSTAPVGPKVRKRSRSSKVKRLSPGPPAIKGGADSCSPAASDSESVGVGETVVTTPLRETHDSSFTKETHTPSQPPKLQRGQPCVRGGKRGKTISTPSNAQRPQIKVEEEEDEEGGEDDSNARGNDFSSNDFGNFQHTEFDGLDMMSLPMDLGESHGMSVNLDDIKHTPELMQETHACFFSLVRDIICSTPEQRMAMSTMEESLRSWQESPISPLNDWYAGAQSWVQQLGSAIRFLLGDSPDIQPEDFVPYLEFKTQSKLYQWIGAGRDSDSHLMPLCQHWLDRRDEAAQSQNRTTVAVTEREETPSTLANLTSVLEECDEGPLSPPPPRCPTTWTVRPSTDAERQAYREQELLRYENPHKAFTFRMHGYESVVGPVKGAYSQGGPVNKPRGHSLLAADRPNFVTILSLVRDATARLPNGEGTRSEVCELLRDSQFLAPVGHQESYLQSVVSGALDRLHYDPDPCVRYDTKRKMWIYLHRGRSEEEFEKLHQQQCFMTKTKKSSTPRKPSRSKQKDSQKDAGEALIKTEVSAAVQSVTSTVVTSTTPGLTQPAVAPIRATAMPAASKISRTFSLTGPSVHNLQVSTASGLQTIQVTTTGSPGSNPSLGGATSLLATSLGQAVKAAAAAAAAVRAGGGQTISAGHLVARKGGSLVATSGASGIAPGTTARVVVSAEVAKELRANAAGALSISSSTAPAISSSTTAVPATSLVLQTATTTSRTVTTGTLQGPKTMVASVGSNAQIVSQVQLVGSRSPQASSPKSVVTGKSVVTSAVSGVKLINTQPSTVKTIASGTAGAPLGTAQAIFIKGTDGLTQVTGAGASQQRLSVGVTAAKAQQPVSVAQQGQTAQGKQQVVAKVLTNAQGQVISMESLLAHQKHSGALGQATVRVAASGKPGQASLIQLPSGTPGGVPHFAVVTQGSLISVAGQPRVLQAAHLTAAPQVVAHASSLAGQPATMTGLSATSQAIAKLAAGKPIVAGTGTTNLRMVSPGTATASGLNLAHIGGKPVILASKAQTSQIQGATAGQNMILTSQSLRAQGGTLVLQQGATQQILLPPGFQGGTLNIKTLQGLQGLKVIPIAQATSGKGRQQVYARIISPPAGLAGRPVTNVTGTSLVQGTTVAVQGTSATTAVTSLAESVLVSTSAQSVQVSTSSSGRSQLSSDHLNE